MQTARQTFRWGIWGTGAIAAKFAADLRHVDGAVLHSVCSRDQSKAQLFADRHGIANAVGDPSGDGERFLADPNLDIIYIASPHIVHVEQAVAAARAGKHALIEKPVAMTAAGAREIASAAKTAGTFVMEAMWTRFLPAVQKARDILQSGALGAPVRAEATIHFHRPFDPAHRLFDPALGGGVLLDLGVYPLSVAQFLLGDLSLKQAKWSPAPTGVDATARAELEAGGVPFSFGAGFWPSMREEGDNSFAIYCENGALRVDRHFLRADRLSVWHQARSQLRSMEGGRVARVMTKLLDRPHTVHDFPRETTGLNYQATAVQDAIVREQTSHADMPMAASANVLAMIDAIRSQAPGDDGPYR
ncbi:MAG: Gfo/Idh/MocA family oxidoreductase [Pseudomonadota bacterium]